MSMLLLSLLLNQLFAHSAHYAREAPFSIPATDTHMYGDFDTKVGGDF